MGSSESTRERLLFRIKTKGPQTAQGLAERLELTPAAVRQHLDVLQDEGLVEFEEERGSVGRPVRWWRLTEAGHARFPDSHADLTLDLLESMRAAFGPKALDKLVATRTKALVERYRERVGKPRDLAKRVAALTRLRTEEGYMAEWSRARDGSFTLVENHCPICAAAELCQGLCTGELELFRELLGPRVTVEREEHILEGARRCSYRIRRAKSSDGTR